MFKDTAEFGLALAQRRLQTLALADVAKHTLDTHCTARGIAYEVGARRHSHSAAVFALQYRFEVGHRAMLEERRTDPHLVGEVSVERRCRSPNDLLGLVTKLPDRGAHQLDGTVEIVVEEDVLQVLEDGAVF